MIEIMSKISEVLKISNIPFFLLSIFSSTKQIGISRKKSVDMMDEAPGDNFPCIVTTRSTESWKW